MSATRPIVAEFDGEDELLHAVASTRENGFEIIDVYTPYAVHGLETAMGLRPSRLTWICAACGAIGFGLSLYFEYWTSAVDWPINVGGKPLDSLPAFIPIAFEATILFAGMGAVLALLLRCRLYPGRKPDIIPNRVTHDRFVVIARATPDAGGTKALRELLVSEGALNAQHLPAEAMAGKEVTS